MLTYKLVLFFHILSMIGLVTADVFQWRMLRNAISARNGEESIRWIRSTARLPVIVFPSLITVLGTGIYMAARINAFRQGWISASFLSILLIAVFSIAAGPATRALQRHAQEGKREESQRLLLRPLLVVPLRLRLALLLTITFLMVMRTNLAFSLQIAGMGIACGLLWGVLAHRERRTDSESEGRKR
jgi:uncharacterized membrane protein